MSAKFAHNTLLRYNKVFAKLNAKKAKSHKHESAESSLREVL
jgi:hypothetical protein